MDGRTNERTDKKVFQLLLHVDDLLFSSLILHASYAMLCCGWDGMGWDGEKTLSYGTVQYSTIQRMLGARKPKRAAGRLASLLSAPARLGR